MTNGEWLGAEREGIFDLEGTRRFAFLITIPGSEVGEFEVVGESVEVKNWVGMKVVLELLFESEERSGVVIEIGGEVKVLLGMGSGE